MKGNQFFKEIKGNFGFGVMRLPLEDGKVNYEDTCRLFDTFLEQGFNYFDTAHGYLAGESEIALRECLVKRYPREQFLLVNKLSNEFFETEEEIRPYFQVQLEACGVDYFDFYLMHAQNAALFEKYKKCRAYEIAFELKKEGKVKHVGISFHDKAEVLDRILTECPDIEIVQIQFNYFDYEDEQVESRKCYEVCIKHNKPMIIMEPVRGGRLIRLPKLAQDVFDQLQGGSNASYAIRFAASFDHVVMVLSGMSNMEQLEDNIGFMKEFQPLSETEMEAVWKVSDILRNQELIPCTACQYCVAGCPVNIDIPTLFGVMNEQKLDASFQGTEQYKESTEQKGKASDCIKCGKCEQICPQHLPIRDLLEKVAESFE